MQKKIDGTVSNLSLLLTTLTGSTRARTTHSKWYTDYDERRDERKPTRGVKDSICPFGRHSVAYKFAISNRTAVGKNLIDLLSASVQE